MGIFPTNYAPEVAASDLSDKMLPVCAIRTAETLSCAVLNLKFGDEETPYLPRLNVPQEGIPPYSRPLYQRKRVWAVWAMDFHNYTWLVLYLDAICKEYTRRFEKQLEVGQYIGTFSEVVNHVPFTTNYPNNKKITANSLIFPADMADMHRIPAPDLKKALFYLKEGDPRLATRCLLRYRYLYQYKVLHTWTRCEIPRWLFDPERIDNLRNQFGRPFTKTAIDLLVTNPSLPNYYNPSTPQDYDGEELTEYVPRQEETSMIVSEQKPTSEVIEETPREAEPAKKRSLSWS